MLIIYEFVKRKSKDLSKLVVVLSELMNHNYTVRQNILPSFKSK